MGDSVNSKIEIFCRVKPISKAKVGHYSITESENADEHQIVEFAIPKDLANDFVNNKKEVYRFKFKKVFDQKTKQEEIFNNIAGPVIENCLDGYNGTIFAYGQTGSGKTFTITGGAEKYSDRGIIPRTLSAIFSKVSKNLEISVQVSYLEIYNEFGYDLLDPKQEISKMEDLPKVLLLEDRNGKVHLKNLSLHTATSESEALNLLFLGDTNRMIAETPMNQASTRSHCIFTIHITAREPGSTTVKRSKLNLVDLAGSERVSKTGAKGLLLSEAKFINLSLHYLEQVIVALSEKGRTHVPYRNSMMTSCLRDSLGGNCMTTMIATCSVDRSNLDESISTCRFAQRVALITNEVTSNEEVDPSLVISRLKREVEMLKGQLEASGSDPPITDDLSEEERRACEEALDEFLNEKDDLQAPLDVGCDLRKFHHCLRRLRDKLNDALNNQKQGEPLGPTTPTRVVVDAAWLHDTSGHLPPEIKTLKDTLSQRDAEISILVGMLKRERQGRGSGEPDESMNLTESTTLVGNSNRSVTHNHQHQPAASSSATTMPSVDLSEDSSTGGQDDRAMTARLLGPLSVGRTEAFETWKRDYFRRNPTVHQQKSQLKSKVHEAKSVGEKLNACRIATDKAKVALDHVRKQQAVADAFSPNGGANDSVLEANEAKARESIERHKKDFHKYYSRLKELKQEVDHLQHLLATSDVRMIQEFDSWWQGKQAQVEVVPPLWKSSGDEDADYSSSSSRNHTYVADQKQPKPTSSTKTKPTAPPPVEIPSTGDPETDANIAAFMKARQAAFNS